MGKGFSIPAAVLGALLALLTAAGCASVPGRAANAPMAVSGAGYGISEADIPYNLTDVLFAREMMLHYRQSAALARLAGGRGRDAYVKSLAARILAEEPAKAEVLAGRLRAWEFPVPDPKNPPKHEMPGMLSPAQLLLLERESGPGFDRLWLTTLARHAHYGVLLADKAEAEGKDRATVDLARTAAAAQRAQVEEITARVS
ncbi:DUF305 domain-containing protein [Sphaerisporangium sp. TRM90804]|uniref:DUF305 domain-containing protein n=1 Tax=Sphaerisporangium sp. TRM90804 TaxID=3031113 RepID=UPI002447CF46|nr:DUF305 domain-containing protein [Sphaerisporangium sp. TRM90804]MDH2427745.1 DUF305 domain-containing protein [Sphaerisporangium sp. TRM90804]